MKAANDVNCATKETSDKISFAVNDCEDEDFIPHDCIDNSITVGQQLPDRRILKLGYLSA